MGKRKLYTADEEFRGAAYLVLFTLIWYGSLFRTIWQSGLQSSVLLFLAAGLLAPVQAVRIVRRGLYHRRFSKQVKACSRPRKGRIVNIVREMQTEYSNSRRHQYYFYYLIVEVTDPETGLPSRIRSEAYRIPVYKYLAQPYVDVYVDSSGWKYVLDGFTLKKSRREPDIPLEESNVYLKDFTEQSMFSKVLVFVIFILFLLNILGIF